MPRIARFVVKGCPHHITQRGNYGNDVFSEKVDYLRYLDWFNIYAKKNTLSIIAYCLMPNHVHFIAVPETEHSLARTFNISHMRYSQYFNKKNMVRGHLWQGRFYSCALDEYHLYAAIRYVENNPVRAKLCERAECWRWSSARTHMTGEKAPLILADFSKYLDIDNWQSYLAQNDDERVIDNIKANTLIGKPAGSNEFIYKIESMLK